MNKTLITVIAYAVVSAGIFGAGMFANSKLQRPIKLSCPPCPEMKCPPNVQVNTLPLQELKKMKIKGGFQFAPVYNGTIYLVTTSSDTLEVKKSIEESVKAKK